MAKAVVKTFDMEADTLEFAINQTSYAIDTYNSEREIASYLKQQVRHFSQNQSQHDLW